MFRMEFQSVADDEEPSHSGSDYVNDSVYERYRHSESCYVDSRPAIFEGRVGRFGKVRRVVTLPPALSDLDQLSPWKSRILSPNANLAGTQTWTEAEPRNSPDSPCPQGVTQDEQAIFLDAQVLRELVRPFVELRSDVGNVRREDDDDDSNSVSNSASRSDSMRSDWSFRSDMSSASEGSVAEMNALQRESKPWEEPLLALHQQAEVDLRVENEAKEEAKTLAEEERLAAARRQRELQDLANCVNSSPSRRSFKKNKLQKILSKTVVTAVCRFLKNPFGLFKNPKIYSGYVAREGVDAVVMPRRAFSESHPASTYTDAALAQMRSVPRRQVRSEIQFATVNSTQRDVPAWTMEEYMTKNGKLYKWNRRNDDEEFGGIEGNNLMNQYFDDDVHATYDSDSD